MTCARSRASARRCLASETRGQATVEWIGLVLAIALVLAGTAVVAQRADTLAFASALARQLLCALASDRCERGDGYLERAYGARLAETIRDHAPGLVYQRAEVGGSERAVAPLSKGEVDVPVDWRRCRQRSCASASATAGTALAASARGVPAAAFVHVVRRGGRTYVQYWFYYPDSRTRTIADGLFRLLGRPTPGYHRDDWEAYEIRIEPDGSVLSRASNHGDWFPCRLGALKSVLRVVREELPRLLPIDPVRGAARGIPPVRRTCVEWLPAGRWVRVDPGSHANSLPTPDSPPTRARDGIYVAPADLVLIPLDSHARSDYRELGDVRPPWQKDVFREPEAPDS